MIAKATEATAPGLRRRKLRLGIAPALDKAAARCSSRLVSHKESTQIVGSRVKDDPALLAEGGLDALLRTSDEACAGLHIDRIVVRADDLGTDAGDPGHRARGSPDAASTRLS